MTTHSRKVVALLLGLLITVLAVSAFALAINRYDWGVTLILLAPLLVWLVLRMGKWLERWANGTGRLDDSDPDFPDEPPAA
ncbi:hypothetical protein DWB85_01415 [Seongchinamella sediminis]|uniref:Uncharacterized protein n=1 Tax=Seongchinamella sediminis TaxID=2283635 RepID=A0A3L7E1W6_9GAMM|nr:hypothetical protein [Seongchinamella sediminis]RLQ23838.1 hypothetical protein DWB85_01415 [Seongchinamella sediminis]